jgi:nitrogen fixation protein FixH
MSRALARGAVFVGIALSVGVIVAVLAITTVACLLRSRTLSASQAQPRVHRFPTEAP